MVGTRPDVFFWRECGGRICFIHSMVRIISMRGRCLGRVVVVRY